MKHLTRLIGSLGLLVMIGLIAHEGAGVIVALLARAGWVLLWLVPLHGAPLLLDVLGWYTLLEVGDRERRARLARLFGIAAVREAVNRLLPVANIGGEIVGIRLLVLRGVRGAAAAASVIVETMLNVLAQCAFIALGLLCVLHVTAARHWVDNVLWMLAVALPIAFALLLLLRYGSIFERCARWIERLLSQDSQLRPLLAQSSELDQAIRQLCRSRWRLLRATGWQLAGFVLATSETWLALRWLGSPVTLSNALALEALTQAVRNFVFVVPAGMGVQEAGLMAFGALLGVGGPAAIALSLAKRLREILFGLPALLGWHWLEGRHARARAGLTAR
jgi:putative membrane protein